MGGDELDEYRVLVRARLDHVVRVDQPLVLISQTFRSGGTLLSQLFDAHPECHAHPHELRIGRPSSRDWASLDLAARATWFDSLQEKYPAKHFARGYAKVGGGMEAVTARDDVFPFVFLPRLQGALFDACVDKRVVRTQRDVLDCYFTSYFNAWLDNQNLYAQPKKVVTAFAPDLNRRPESVEAFFRDYPDGTLVSIVREPRAWYASALRQRPHPVGRLLRKWRKSAHRTLDYAERYGNRTVALTYEQLVTEPERTMTRLAERLGIEMLPVMLVPTFNGRPIRANSAEPITRYGVLTERLEAYRDSLDAETITQVDETAGDLYERVRAIAL